MKILLIFVLIPFINIAQESSIYQIEYQARRDSILLETQFGSIYFTRDTSAVSYDYLNPNQIDSTIFTQFYRKMQLELERERSIQTKHFNYPFINSHWTPISRFNNDFCLYGPSDWMEHTELFFTDSLLYNLRSDGDLEFILSVNQISQNSCEIELLNFFNQSQFLKIQLVDDTNGLAIFEWFDENHASFGRSFFVNSDMVRKYPIIIYDCGFQKCAFGDVTFFQAHDFSAY